MQILHTPVQPASLPPCWELDPGDRPATAAEAASALAQLLGDARADAQPCLAQLGAAPDLSDQARDLGLRLQTLIAEAQQTALELQVAAAG